MAVIYVSDGASVALGSQHHHVLVSWSILLHCLTLSCQTDNKVYTCAKPDDIKSLTLSQLCNNFKCTNATATAKSHIREIKGFARSGGLVFIDKQ